MFICLSSFFVYVLFFDFFVWFWVRLVGRVDFICCFFAFFECVFWCFIAVMLHLFVWSVGFVSLGGFVVLVLCLLWCVIFECVWLSFEIFGDWITLVMQCLYVTFVVGARPVGQARFRVVSVDSLGGLVFFGGILGVLLCWFVCFFVLVFMCFVLHSIFGYICILDWCFLFFVLISLLFCLGNIISWCLGLLLLCLCFFGFRVWPVGFPLFSVVDR